MDEFTATTRHVLVIPSTLSRTLTQRWIGSYVASTKFVDYAAWLMLTLVLYWIVNTAQNAVLSPLKQFPGPWYCAWTNLAQAYWKVTGRDHEIIKSLHEKYGPVVRLGPKHLSYIGTSRVWTDIYGGTVGYKNCLPKDKMLYGLLEDCYGWKNTLLTAPDDTGLLHKILRKLVSTSFVPRMNFRSEPRYKSCMQKMTSYLWPRADQKAVLDLSKAFLCLAVDVQTDMILSIDAESLKTLDSAPPNKGAVEGPVQGIAFATVFRLFAPTLGKYAQKALLQIPQLRQALEAFDGSLSDRIEMRLRNPPADDDVLSEIQKRTELSPVPIAKDQFLQTVKIVSFAGPEAIVSILSATCYYLCRNPSTYKRLTREIRSRFDTQEDISIEAVTKMDYLTAVIKESQRLYPLIPSMLPRKTPRSGAWINGVWIPPNTGLGVHQWSTFRSETLFKDSKDFLPERWMGEPEFQEDQLDSLHPFSTGARRCPAEQFSWCILRLTIAFLLFNFDIELAEESEDWSNQAGYFIWKPKPLLCRIIPANREGLDDE